MNYQSSISDRGVSADLVVVASLAVAFSMFVAGYAATRASLSSTASQAVATELKDTEVNVVGHEGTLWQSVSQPAQ